MTFQRVKDPYTSGYDLKVLASRKVVYCKVCTEGSGTAKSGTDEQERHMRLIGEDKQAHLFNVLSFHYHRLVDAAGIGGRKKLLPGEVLLVENQPVRSQQKP